MDTLRHLAALAAVALAVGLTSPARSQTQDPPPFRSPVLTVNQEALFDRSDYGSRIQRELEAASAALAAENRTIEAALSKEEQDLTDARATTDPAEFRTLAEAFDTKVVEIRRQQDQKERDLLRRPDEARQEFLRAALPVLAQIVQERGAVAILDARAVIISADIIDITEEAIRRIDATLGDGSATPAPAPAPEAPAPEAPEAPAPAAPETAPQAPAPTVTP
jgi:Skp family chaperone for outer membrane proteins